jgi:outer membrane protein assembly factor BamE (lipoprotein component of BamABCDE complex)
MRNALQLLAICLLTGCELLPGIPTAHHINALSVGMSREEVLSALGSPVSKGADSSSETLYYRLYDTAADAERRTGTTYFVRFVNQRVESFGRLNEPFAEIERAVRAQPSPPAPVPVPPLSCPPCICPAT